MAESPTSGDSLAQLVQNVNLHYPISHTTGKFALCGMIRLTFITVSMPWVFFLGTRAIGPKSSSGVLGRLISAGRPFDGLERGIGQIDQSSHDTNSQSAGSCRAFGFNGPAETKHAQAHARRVERNRAPQIIQAGKSRGMGKDRSHDKCFV